MVVVTKYYAMDDGGSKGKRSLFRRMFWSPSPHPGRSPSNQSLLSPPRERRPLRSVPFSGPEYKVDPDVLVKEFVEKETRYMGTVRDTKADFNTSDRSLMLSLVDEKRRVGQLPWQLTYKEDVILSFSVYNIKISYRDGEQLVHRIPTHKISATGFIQDDRDVFLFIKFASELGPEMCNIAFFNCLTKESAQELCCLTQQLFQLVYTESTMDFFDKSIQDGAVTPKHHSYSTDDSDKRNTIVTQGANTNGSSLSQTGLMHRESPVTETFGEASILSCPSSAPSSIHRQHHNGNAVSPISSISTPSSPAITRRKRRSESSSGSFTQSSSHQHQLKEYIDVLKERLTTDELRQFAQELHNFRTRGLKIQTFCDNLLQIYKEHRKSLLLGMRHFIPDPKEKSYFEMFLKQHDVTSVQDDRQRWWDQPPAPDSRTTSETEGSSAHSTAVHSEQLAEISSNSDHASTSPTSRTGSGDWGSVMNVQSGDVDSSTLKSNQVNQPSTSKHDTDEAVNVDDIVIGTEDVVIGTEEGDSPLLRSGEDAYKHDESPSLLAPARRGSTLERQKVIKKKSRGKSPSAVELGAPFPSIGVTQSDDDVIDDVADESRKKEGKKKGKSSAAEKDSKKKKKPKKIDLKKLKSEEASSALTTPQNPEHELPPSLDEDPQPKIEHRKKKRHKKADEGVVTEL